VNLAQTAPSLLEQIAFFILAAGMLGGALVTITRKSAVGALMALIATFCASAGLYATLSAHFLAVLQVLVYAGAIMVVFIFAVMIVSHEEEHPIALRGLFLRGTGVLAIGYMFYRVAWLVARERTSEVLAATAPPPIPGFGNVASIGRLLFSDFIFPFEAVSLLLLAAVVGGVVLARPPESRQDGGTV